MHVQDVPAATSPWGGVFRNTQACINYDPAFARVETDTTSTRRGRKLRYALRPYARHTDGGEEDAGRSIAARLGYLWCIITSTACLTSTSTPPHPCFHPSIRASASRSLRQQLLRLLIPHPRCRSCPRPRTPSPLRGPQLLTPCPRARARAHPHRLCLFPFPPRIPLPALIVTIPQTKRIMISHRTRIDRRQGLPFRLPAAARWTTR